MQNGTPQPFSFYELTSAADGETSGQLTLDGNWDESYPVVGQSLIIAVQNTLAQSLNCSSQTYRPCTPIKRSNYPESESCGYKTIQQCTAVNYVQATYYNPSGDQMGQITVQGSSTSPSPFGCQQFVDAIGAGADVIAVGIPAFGAVSPILTLICDIVGGK
jgi:hypothetical protein